MMRNSLWNRDLFDGFMNDMFEDDFFGPKKDVKELTQNKYIAIEG